MFFVIYSAKLVKTSVEKQQTNQKRSKSRTLFRAVRATYGRR